MRAFLVVRFGDNDFHRSLTELGNWLLREVDLEALEHLVDSGEASEILTIMFRHQLCLNQHRFDMYKDFGSLEELKEKCEGYSTRSYFQLKDISLIPDWIPEDDNGETLVVDYINREVHIV